jgi:hypothetical protein
LPQPYVLTDLLSGNLFAAYASEDEAWGALRSWAEEFGLDELHDLGLMRVQDGELTLVAMDDELVQRVRELTKVTTSR